MKDGLKNDVLVFKALADEKRLNIIELLQTGEKCACDLIAAMKIGQSSLSYHMRILCESKIVECRISGKWTYYSLSKTANHQAAKRIIELTTVTRKTARSCSDCENNH